MATHGCPAGADRSELRDGDRHPVAVGLEAEFLVERERALVVGVDVQCEFRAVTVPRPLGRALDEPVGQAGPAVRSGDAEVAHDEPVGLVEDARGLLDVGRDEADEVAVVIGDPRPVPLGFEPVEPGGAFLGVVADGVCPPRARPPKRCGSRRPAGPKNPNTAGCPGATVPSA